MAWRAGVESARGGAKLGSGGGGAGGGRPKEVDDVEDAAGGAGTGDGVGGWASAGAMCRLTDAFLARWPPIAVVNLSRVVSTFAASSRNAMAAGVGPAGMTSLLTPISA